MATPVLLVKTESNPIVVLVDNVQSSLFSMELQICSHTEKGIEIRFLSVSNVLSYSCECPKCEGKFVSISSLKQHMKSHDLPIASAGSVAVDSCRLPQISISQTTKHAGADNSSPLRADNSYHLAYVSGNKADDTFSDSGVNDVAIELDTADDADNMYKSAEIRDDGADNTNNFTDISADEADDACSDGTLHDSGNDAEFEVTISGHKAAVEKWESDTMNIVRAIKVEDDIETVTRMTDVEADEGMYVDDNSEGTCQDLTLVDTVKIAGDDVEVDTHGENDDGIGGKLSVPKTMLRKVAFPEHHEVVPERLYVRNLDSSGLSEANDTTAPMKYREFQTDCVCGDNQTPQDKDSCIPSSVVTTPLSLINKPKRNSRRRNSLKCNLCDKTLSGWQKYIEHRNAHLGEKPYICAVCNKGFSVKAHLNAHSKLHSGGGHTCPECGKQFVAVSALKLHRMMHTGEQPHVCVLCGKRFRLKKSYMHHILGHSNEAHFCAVCGKAFRRPGNLRSHMKMHTDTGNNGDMPESRTRSCTICRKTFHKAADVKGHMKIHTSNESECKPRTRSCTVCGKEFCREGNLKSHMKIHAEFGNRSEFKPQITWCTICGKTLLGDVDLKDHMKIHTDLGDLRRTNPHACPCNICGKTLRRESDLIDHMRAHTGEKPFSCAQCGKTFQRLTYLHRHQILHKTEKARQCSVCEKRFHNLAYLKIHMRVHTGEKPHVCKTCSKSFSLRSILIRHMERERHGVESSDDLPENTPLPCSCCGKMFYREYLRKRHINREHGEKSFPCEVCGKVFKKKAVLRIHGMIHTGGKPYCCSVCGKMFRWKPSLDNHYMLHSGEKPFPCLQCGRMFRRKHQVELHTRVHTKEKPFKCTYCDKAFACSSGRRSHTKAVHEGKYETCKVCNKVVKEGYLKNHSLIHDKRHSCPFCDKKFSRKDLLNDHVRIHTGEKPFKCTHCGLAVSSHAALWKHLKYKHNETKSQQ